MSAAWFSFSVQDFSYAFLSVLLEGVPFILLGTLLSGLIDQFLPSRLMTRLLPRNAFAAVCLGGVMGAVFPMCECGIVPVIRRLIAKGLPVSSAVAYMLAAPIVNPITAISTYAAFRGQGAAEFTALRLGLGFFIAVLAGLAVLNLPIGAVLKKTILESVTLYGPAGDAGAAPFRRRLVAAMESSVRDFLDVMVYFILGVGVASLFSTAVNQELFLPLSLDDRLAIPAMMSLAGILSLCSSSDAFIAATFVAFPAVAKLAFLVFGPMMDLKLAFIYSAVFTRRFVASLALGLFVITGLLCLRLAVVLP
ncbi:MAG: permease [Spartobacteria bacterium]